MAFILPERQTPGAMFGAGLGKGISEGLSSALGQFFEQKKLAQKQSNLEKYFNSKEGQATSPEDRFILGGQARGLWDSPTTKTLLGVAQKQRENKEFNDYLKKFRGKSSAPQEAQQLPEQGQLPGQAQPQQQSSMPSQVLPSDEELIDYTASKNPQIAAHSKALLEQNRFEKKQAGALGKESRAEERELSKDFLKQNEAERLNIDELQSNLNMMKENARDVGNQDYIAELTGFEPLRTAKGAAFKTAGKDFYINSLKGADSRPNQWIEKQIQTAMQQVGKTPEANLAIGEIQQLKLDLIKKKIEISDRLSQQYRDKLGYVPARISREVFSEMKDYVKTREDQMSYNLRKNAEAFMGERDKKYIYNAKVRSGTPLTIETFRILEEKYGDQADKVAKTLGYKILPDQFYLEQIQ